MGGEEGEGEGSAASTAYCNSPPHPPPPLLPPTPAPFTLNALHSPHTPIPPGRTLTLNKVMRPCPVPSAPCPTLPPSPSLPPLLPLSLPPSVPSPLIRILCLSFFPVLLHSEAVNPLLCIRVYFPIFFLLFFFHSFFCHYCSLLRTHSFFFFFFKYTFPSLSRQLNFT